ncbi:MAG: 50S ribosome-binding GTPase [Desulfobacteraceae bacterium]|jgi:GTP-binding protein EngB required for normal cell division
MAKQYLAALEARGRIETHVRDITELQNTLRKVPLWRPAAVLDKQAEEAKGIIADLKRRLDGRLVVTIIGPSGAGKSTLFNALAGKDDLSPVGSRRPTTREPLVLADDAQAARRLLGDSDNRRPIVTTGSARHIILVDTPDTDSVDSSEHVDELLQAVRQSDVLICVFDAQNPLRRDHADFMAPLVRRFHGASLVAVANKCDRLDARELTDEIGPGLEDYLKKAWDTQPDAVLLISARRNLQDPHWESQAGPRHALDQFDLLKQLVFEHLNQPGIGRDRRIANAGQIRNYIADRIRQSAKAHGAVLVQSLEQMAQAEQQALKEALEQLRSDDRQQLMGVQVRIYQALAQRWLGPVGWLVAIWSRLIVFGSGLTALLRFGNPLRQLWGMVSSWRRFKESRSALALLEDQTRADAALDKFLKAMMIRWPDIAGQLVSAGFDTAVHDLEVSSQAQTGRALETMWADALTRQIDQTAKRLSNIVLQLIFNLPGVALMGYVGWLTAKGFFSRVYLTSDFFLHALLTIGLILLLSFFLFQGIVRLAAGRGRIQRRAFEAVERTAAQQPVLATREIARQVATVIELAGADDAGK